MIVLLFPTSMFAIQIIHGEFGQSWFCYILHAVYASRFFSQKTQDAKMAIICFNGGVCEKINFIKKTASYFKILKIIWATNFFLANHVCPHDAHRYFIICNVRVLVFEIMVIKNIPFSCHWQ